MSGLDDEYDICVALSGGWCGVGSVVVVPEGEISGCPQSGHGDGSVFYGSARSD
jgi:hypothetical protein